MWRTGFVDIASPPGFWRTAFEHIALELVDEGLAGRRVTILRKDMLLPSCGGEEDGVQSTGWFLHGV